MKQEIQAPSTAITNPGIAEEMAYGEKPYQELALAANDLGLDQEVAQLKAKANDAGVAAGRTAIATISQQIEAGASANLQAPEVAEESNEMIGIWVTLSPEKQGQAKAVITAMAEKYGKEEAEFSLVQTENEAGETLLTAVYNGNGIDLGDPSKDYDKKRSYNSVMAEKNNKEFMVEVDGRQIDTRSGMTERAYRALVTNAQERGATLPDSEKMAKENDDIWAWTLLTGEPADGRGTRFARVLGGRPYVDWSVQGNGYWFVRFRPAVVIE